MKQGYVVYRHGWNAVNQDAALGLPEKMAVARVEANSREEACEMASRQITLQPNQYLSAELAAEVDAKEAMLNQPA